MQTLIVYIILGAAVSFLIWKLTRPAAKKDCGKDCNCK